MMSKKLFRFVFVLAIVLVPTAPVHAEQSDFSSTIQETIVYVDNNAVTTNYMMHDGDMYVPALFFKHTGAYVDWLEQEQAILFHAKEKMITVPVSKRHSNVFERAFGFWSTNNQQKQAFFFNEEIFVPLVEIAHRLEMSVRYDPIKAKTFITTHIHVPSPSIGQVNTEDKLVALTFDDGPDDIYTPQILDILKEKNAVATFFLVGEEIQAYPDMVRRIVQEGHGLGNHTWQHPNLATIWTEKVREEIKKTQQAMLEVVGRQPDLFRPPYGSLTKADLALLNEIGLRNILWSVDTLDWSGRSADEILLTVHENISKGGIILQHNFGSTEHVLDGTIEALPKIIDELREEGYTFVTVQTLLQADNRQ
ncbi:polysaccharide deacetylase family protein [Alkalihalobacillus oceani]|uniref:polysaccharide deacetylase family protein n=1 Tax=Halalkalibacter oceani TaxID=1653776 RepID=UPI002040909B|nr:polysaccharide deacetylase family protein [Halalkalibacter oceani]MCM3762174.1 polysaccharide deacetylase family protein [Halalkalibacter oceani]